MPSQGRKKAVIARRAEAATAAGRSEAAVDTPLGYSPSPGELRKGVALGSKVVAPAMGTSNASVLARASKSPAPLSQVELPLGPPGVEMRQEGVPGVPSAASLGAPPPTGDEGQAMPGSARQIGPRARGASTILLRQVSAPLSAARTRPTLADSDARVAHDGAVVSEVEGEKTPRPEVNLSPWLSLSRSGGFGSASLLPGRNCQASAYRTVPMAEGFKSASVAIGARWEARLGRHGVAGHEVSEGVDQSERRVANRDLESVSDVGATIIDLRDGGTGRGTSTVRDDDVHSCATLPLSRGEVGLKRHASSVGVAQAAKETSGLAVAGASRRKAVVRKSAWIVDPISRVGIMLALPGFEVTVIGEQPRADEPETGGAMVEVLVEERVRLISAWALQPSPMAPAEGASAR